MARSLVENRVTPTLDSPFGHKLSYVFRVNDLLSSKILIYDVNCLDVPSSWQFQVCMRADPESDMPNFPVSLMRVDYMEEPLDAIIEFNAYDVKGLSLSQVFGSISKNGMVVGNELRTNFETYAPFPQMKNILNYEIYVGFTVRIFNCHSLKTEAPETTEEKW